MVEDELRGSDLSGISPRRPEAVRGKAVIVKEGNLIKCDHPAGCDTSIKNHSWGKIKAGGWLFRKNGTHFCSEHKPEWYDQWKKRKK